MKSFERWWQEQQTYDIEYVNPNKISTREQINKYKTSLILECPCCGKDVSSEDWVEDMLLEFVLNGVTNEHAQQVIQSIGLHCGDTPTCTP